MAVQGYVVKTETFYDMKLRKEGEIVAAGIDLAAVYPSFFRKPQTGEEKLAAAGIVADYETALKKEKQKKYRLYRTRYGYIQLPYQYAYKQYTGHCAQRKLTDTQFPQPESQEYSEENGKFGAFPELVENPFHNQVV